jgi:multidrug transporter EmrE-like cation transporter
MKEYNLYLIILLVALLEALAQCSIYYSNVSKNDAFFILGIFFYVCVSFAVYKAYHYKGIGMVNAIWSAIVIVLLLIVGVLLFKEKISTQEFIGIAFIIIGIILTKHFD